MDYTNLRRQIISMKKSLFDQGYLDEQFNQLEELQDDSSPNFVEEVVALFFKDSSRLLTNIEQALEKYPQDFYRLDSLVHQFKGSGSSIGALRMKNECSMFKAHCNDRNLEGYRTLDDSSSSIPASHSLLLHLIPWLTLRCRRSLQKMKREHATLKQKLETYFHLLRQVGPPERAVNSWK
ncbi:pseudo histidine-containing phosphotransfer protein 2 isoform X1 [Sorghum bicolor]|uniref:pseudo histidine-containing phosphotransfer protein 2 isoform X1 n=1 Tax=Sorghum bicolor TaxID=4558 RepID=UPI000B423A23|nr:pseudo histidine-containing phosphotransfer protein 2 isoform X1 [Sorghum bicolor]|eukprot:XP_021302602.1 pseudo histidine-containing phosphotransfer protein 2 isoform X1 [Sorghum bicolor]